jgi:hypothetical protein
MLYDFLIVGAGLSAVSFLHGLNKQKKKIIVLSYQPKNKACAKDNLDDYEFPAKLKDKDKYHVDYFKNYLNIKKSDKNINLFGSMNDEGNSKFWGLHYELGTESEISFLKKKNYKDLKKSFEKMYKDFFFLGKTHENFGDNNKLIDDYFNFLLNSKSKKKLKFKDCALAIIKNKYENLKNLSWDDNSKKSTFTPSTFFNRFNKTKFIKKNYLVKKIKKKKNFYEVYCSDEKKSYVINAKKLIFASGTLSTTKILSEFINFNGNIRILHNPMAFFSYISFNKKINKINLSYSQLCFSLLNKKNYAFGSLRSINNNIIKKICKQYGLFGYIVNIILHLFKKFICIGNLYLNGSESNLLIKSENGKLINAKYQKIRNIKNELKKNYYNFIKNLKYHDKNIIYHKSIIPKLGSDYHYFGSIPIVKNFSKSKLEVDQFCRLKNHKNIYIVDGSVISKISSKFPTGIMMANAHRIAKYLSGK